MKPEKIPSWSRARIAPCIVRAFLARCKDGDGRERIMTDVELMKKTGWGRKYLRSIYQRSSFDDVTNRDTDLFLWACGLHPSKQRRYVFLLKRAWEKGADGILNMRHLQTAVPWQIVQVKRLMNMVESVLKI